MDAMEIAVVVGGIALIGFVLWYFFGERESVAANVSESGVQEIKVTVRGGYTPDVIVVKAGPRSGLISTATKRRVAATGLSSETSESPENCPPSTRHQSNSRLTKRENLPSPAG